MSKIHFYCCLLSLLTARVVCEMLITNGVQLLAVQVSFVLHLKHMRYM